MKTSKGKPYGTEPFVAFVSVRLECVPRTDKKIKHPLRVKDGGLATELQQAIGVAIEKCEVMHSGFGRIKVVSFELNTTGTRKHYEAVSRTVFF